MSDEVLLHRSGAIARIELNRPEALNAWTPESGRQLLAYLREVGLDPEVRAVVIHGAGRGFSAGADVKSPRELTPEGDPDLSVRLREIYNPCIVEVRTMPKPVIAAVHGPCAGIGCSLALACDQVVAAPDARFLLAFVLIGVMPDGGVLHHIAARAGAGRAARMGMLGERVEAQQALEWGLVDELADDHLVGAFSAAERLAALPTVAIASMKEVLNVSTGLENLLALEAELQQRHATTHDYAEGVAAFREKRLPDFLGR